MSRAPVRVGTPSPGARWVTGIVCVFFGAMAWPGGGSAQEGPGALAAACADGAGQALQERCADAALAAHALLGGVGLLVSAGGALPVSPSTAGHRLDGEPRLVLDGGMSLGSFRRPDLTGTDASGAPDGRTTLVAGRMTVSAGIFDGLSAAPTVGGVGSVDGVATLRVVRLPSSDGFDGSVASLGGGVRIGLLRESFSLPGVTVTLLHHRIRTLRYGSLEEHGARATVNPRVTSARLEAGKDMLPIGLLAGAGWDRISGDAHASARTEGSEGAGGATPLRENRRYLFAGVNYTWLVSQLAAELTWAPGRGLAEPLEGTGPFRPGAAAVQAAVTVRVLH